MRRVALCLALVGLLGVSGQAVALIGTIDDVPAATLLLPYFEVDLAGTDGVTTLFSINNASATAILAHVTVWSDQSVPVLDFDVYLTGFDVQTINLRDILVLRNLPVTGSVGQDPDDTISPHGPISQDINFASCNGTLPYTNPAISVSFANHLQCLLRGATSPATGTCYGANYGGRSCATTTNSIMRGYVTVDTVNACNLLFPSQPGYFPGVGTFQNTLWGDYFYVHPGQNFAQGETLVHIEACRPPGSGLGNNPAQNLEVCPFVPGDHTFYGRYLAAAATDQREPLPTTLAARYLTGGGFDGGTDFLVWREGDNTDDPYTCAGNDGPPSWHPLPANQIVLFDEEENPVQQEDCPSGDPTCEQEVGIPNEAQRVDVAVDLLSPFDFGWAFLNLGHPEIVPVYGDDDAQAWVTAVADAEGRFSVGFDAIQLDNANNPNTTVLPVQ